MSSNLGSVYSSLFKEYKALHPALTAAESQREFNKIWAQMKEDCSRKKTVLLDEAKRLLSEYQNKRTEKKAKNILSFFPKQVSIITSLICSYQTCS